MVCWIAKECTAMMTTSNDLRLFKSHFAIGSINGSTDLMSFIHMTITPHLFLSCCNIAMHLKSYPIFPQSLRFTMHNTRDGWDGIRATTCPHGIHGKAVCLNGIIPLIRWQQP